MHLRAAGTLATVERAARASLDAATATATLYAWDEPISHADAAVTMLVRAGASPPQRGETAPTAAQFRLRSSIGLETLTHLEHALEQYQAAGDEATVALVHRRRRHVLACHHSVMDIPAALDHLRAVGPVPKEASPQPNTTILALATVFALRLDEGCAAAKRAIEAAVAQERPDLVATRPPHPGGARVQAREDLASTPCSRRARQTRSAAAIPTSPGRRR